METDKYLKKIDTNDYIEETNGSSLNQMLNSFFQELNEGEQLIKQSSIAGMNQIVVATPDKPIIGTQGLDTCFGILLYDRKNKFGVCGHASPHNIFGIVAEMLKEIPVNVNGTIEYAIIPGYRAIKQHNFEGVEEILHILRSYSSINTKIKFTSLNTSIEPSMPKGLLCYDFAFDTKTGQDVTSIIFMDSYDKQNKRHF